MTKIDELLTRAVANIIPGKPELKKLLESGKKLNIYLGIDPTATKIHLGHAVPLRKLQEFASMGHNVTFLIGDFTALVGDTSDKDTERPVLTPEQIEANFQTYKKQAEKIVDFSKVTVVHNSEWLSKLDFNKVIKLVREFSLNDFIGRELIKKRLEQNTHVGLLETMYPLMQGYDSYHLNTDIQLGGTDQTFNMQAGRTLLKRWKNKESFIIANPFLEGTDGRKMSKSWGNAIWLDDTPTDMYAKVMAIKDDLIIQYFTLGTSLSLEAIDQMDKDLKAGQHPMHIKQLLAIQIVTELSGKEEATRAQEHFQKTVQQKQLPNQVEEVILDASELPLMDLLVKTGLATSNAEAKRLVEQGGVEIDNERMTDSKSEIIIKEPIIVKVGKRKIVRITINK